MATSGNNGTSSGDLASQPRSILKKRDSSLAVPNRKSLVKTQSLEMEDAYAIPTKKVSKQQLLMPPGKPPKQGSESTPSKPAKVSNANRPKSSTPPTPIRANRGSSRQAVTNGRNQNKTKSADDQMSSFVTGPAGTTAGEKRQSRRDREVMITPIELGDKCNNMTADGRPKSFMKKLFLMQ